MAGHVYLIGSPLFRWYKIGKSSNASIRVTDLGVLLPFRIEVVAVWKTNNYHQLERDLHLKHAANRINGEWFSFSKEEVKGIVDDMLWASTDIAATFSNLDSDWTPQGKVPHVRYREPRESDTWTPEQREQKKQECIAKKLARQFTKDGLTPEVRKQKKANAIAERVRKKEEHEKLLQLINPS